MGVKEFYWLAGIIEGEGNFSIKNNSSPTITISMTDEDVIDRVAKILKRPYSKEDRSHRPNAKDIYTVNICGVDAISWMFTLYSLFGKRRQAKILEIIKFWRAVPVTKNKGNYCNVHQREITHLNGYKSGKYTLRCAECLNDSKQRLYERRKASS